MSKQYNLPRGYLSSSACDLWEQNQEQFRRKYYDGEDGFRTVYTEFGKSFAKEIENNPEKFPNIPKYKIPEFPIKWVIDGVPVLGFVDSFCPDNISVIEYKTAVKTGTSPWTNVKVRKWKQLPFYSMCLEQMFGRVDPVIKLIVLHTEWQENVNEQVFGDKTFTKTERTLNFNPDSLLNPIVFEREIRDWERALMRERLVSIASQVSADFTSYQQG